MNNNKISIIDKKPFHQYKKKEINNFEFIDTNENGLKNENCPNNNIKNLLIDNKYQASNNNLTITEILNIKKTEQAIILENEINNDPKKRQLCKFENFYIPKKNNFFPKIRKEGSLQIVKIISFSFNNCIIKSKSNENSQKKDDELKINSEISITVKDNYGNDMNSIIKKYYNNICSDYKNCSLDNYYFFRDLVIGEGNYGMVHFGLELFNKVPLAIKRFKKGWIDESYKKKKR